MANTASWLPRAEVTLPPAFSTTTSAAHGVVSSIEGKSVRTSFNESLNLRQVLPAWVSQAAAVEAVLP